MTTATQWWRAPGTWVTGCGLHSNPFDVQAALQNWFPRFLFSKTPASRTLKCCSALVVLLMCIPWCRSFISKWCSLPASGPLCTKLQHGECGRPAKPSPTGPLGAGYPFTSARGKPTHVGKTAGSCVFSHYWCKVQMHWKLLFLQLPARQTLFGTYRQPVQFYQWQAVGQEERDAKNSKQKPSSFPEQVSKETRSTATSAYAQTCWKISLLFAYFQIAASIGLGLLCLIGWEIRKKM